MLSDNFVEFTDISVPDSRWGSFALISPEGIRHMTLEKWYLEISKIQCDVELSERLQKRLNEVKNLLVYSWFVYSFASTAFLMSVLMVEAYLKETGILKKGQMLGNFVKDHKEKSLLPEVMIIKLAALVSLRNRYAHEDVSLHVPGSMLMSVKNSLSIIAALSQHHLGNEFTPNALTNSRS